MHTTIKDGSSFRLLLSTIQLFSFRALSPAIKHRSRNSFKRGIVLIFPGSPYG